MKEKEKKELRKRIMTSAYAYKTRRRRIRYSIAAAASVLIIMAIGFYSYNNSQNPIKEFVESSESKTLEKTNDVQLVLNGNKKLAINKNNSNLTYAADGRGVDITDSLGGDQEVVVDDPHTFNTLIVPYGKRSSIVLSDGTKVWLNSGSKLIYPASFNGKNREVYLKGEGIFEVSHDAQHPFRVLSGDQTVEVLGTVFNISNYTDENSIRTVLKNGSVEISHKSHSFFRSQESKKIVPGTMAVYNRDNKSLETKKVNVENYFSWREGVLIFKNNNLKYIMKKLDRYYNVTIKFQELEMEEETFSGYLDLKDSIEGVLKTLQAAAGFDYSINENGSILINKLENMD